MRVLLLALALTGCLAPGAGVDRAATADATLHALRDALADLPCDAAVGEGTSANLRELALEQLGEGTHGELAIHGTLAAVARYQTGGAELVDVADPQAPHLLATWDPDEADRALDVKFTPDGATLLVGGDKAITLLDVHDPSTPRVESVYALTKPQAHMLTVFEAANATWVAAAKGAGHDLEIHRIAGEPGARTLEPASRPRLTLAGETTGNDLLRSHDAWATHDKKLGKPLLWVANSWDGILALDVSDPERPTIATRIPPLDPHQGYTHTVQTTTLDDRRLVVAVQEVGANALKVYDATDLAAPHLVALWHVPVALKAQHNLQLVGNLAFVAHYDEGTYALDLENIQPGPTPTRLTPIARLAPAAGNPTPTGPNPASGFGGTWDIVVSRGLLHTTEIDHGLRTTAFGCLNTGDPTHASTG